MSEPDYVIRVLNSSGEIAAQDWNALLALQPQPSPFMRHEYLLALEANACAVPQTGWTPRFITLWEHGAGTADKPLLCGACALYLKTHSRGEYVFDWAWAHAYEQHGVPYYPKALAAIPFTPVPGTRLLVRDVHARRALIHALLAWCRAEELPSLHLLFLDDDDAAICKDAGLLLRHNVQFHWRNAHPETDRQTARGYRDFDEFLQTLTQEKRKKIRQERRKVMESGVVIHPVRGSDITSQDWDFFYSCYERTYLEHGNPPYLNRGFFVSMANAMPHNWLLFVAQRDGVRIGCSLIGLSGEVPEVAYGRYWGALQRVDCLHFELCYYQPLQWCIENGAQRFEGGAQGEHKMARALLPVKTASAHWLAHPAFADAVRRFLVNEEQGVQAYLRELGSHSPLRRPDTGSPQPDPIQKLSQSPSP